VEAPGGSKALAARAAHHYELSLSFAIQRAVALNSCSY
jgi:hypothetical protein